MTNERERFWSTVDESLDARRDPCEVAFVQEWIADHPEDRDEMARLLRGVDVVGRIASTCVARSRAHARGCCARRTRRPLVDACSEGKGTTANAALRAS